MSIAMTREDRLADLLERWENAATSGQRPSPEDFCKDTPDDLPAFRDLLKQLGMAGLVTASGKRNSDAHLPGFRAGRYTATDYHAAGGLGVVYRAKDEELNRTVALKCMKTAANADSPIGRRFLLEAEVTSHLEHPGIAPVHGRGKTDDGRPFYTMRFIEGETLQDATRRFHAPAGIAPGARNVELRRLLRAFVGVCETVAYAHSRGVIHRDLKPANVMVGPFGEVLVMDWGLAKSGVRDQGSGVRDQESAVADEAHETVKNLGADTAPNSSHLTPLAEGDTPLVDLTVYGRAKGSPSFMSPEQARGEWDRVGPASDIYSLGSTLFYLLTGRVPYDGRTSAEVVAKVKEGIFAAARNVNDAVAPALDAICRKAMARDPGNRYPSARALADDVERWLADEPVSAWKEPWIVKLRRWARRHRTLVTATSAALVVGFVLLAVYGYRLDRKNRDLDQANGNLELANEREIAEREKADERFQIALESNANLVTDIQSKLVRSPGTREVRESLLKGAIARLEQLLAKAEESREVDRTKIVARLKLGDLYREVEQNPTKAEGEYTRALALARQVLQDHPSDPASALGLVETLHRLGRVEVQLGRFGQASALYSEASERIETLGGNAVEPRATNLTRRAELALETGDARSAAGQFGEARAIWEKQAADPGNEDAAFALGQVLLSQGQAADATGRFSDAIAHYTSALERWRALRSRRPTDVTIQRELAQAHNGLAQASAQLGKRADSASHYREFLNIVETLAQQDPNNGEAQLELALAHHGLALDALQRFDLKSAEEHSAKALLMVERVARIDPANLDGRRNCAVGLAAVADLARKRQKFREAASQFDEAIHVCRGILRDAPERTITIGEMAEWLRQKGEIEYRQLGDKAKGLEAVRESLKIWQSLVDADPANLRSQERCLEIHELLGGYNQRQKRFDEADATFRAGLGNLERLLNSDRDSPIVRWRAGQIRADLAKLALDRKKPDEAIAATEEEIEALTQKTKEQPNDVHIWELLDASYAFLAEVYKGKGDAAKSGQFLRKGITAAEHGLKVDPEHRDLRDNLQQHLARLGEIALPIDPAAARKLYDEALTHSRRYPPDLAETYVLRHHFAAYEAKAGDCCEMLNQPSDALEHYKRVIAHHEIIAQIEPNEPRVPAFLAYDHRRMAEIRMYLVDFDGAVKDYEKAKEYLEKMRAIKEPSRPMDKETESIVRTTESLIKMNLPFVKTLPKGIETLEAAMKQPAALRLEALRWRAAMLFKANKLDEMAETAEQMAKVKSLLNNPYIMSAEEFCRLATTEHPKAKAFASRAIELLGKAKADGYFSDPEAVAWLNWEPLFEPLRKEEAFQTLVMELSARGKK
jgi:eukaryotic-like serine/threonine-protein kinase